MAQKRRTQTEKWVTVMFEKTERVDRMVLKLLNWKAPRHDKARVSLLRKLTSLHLVSTYTLIEFVLRIDALGCTMIRGRMVLIK